MRMVRFPVLSLLIVSLVACNYAPGNRSTPDTTTPFPSVPQPTGATHAGATVTPSASDVPHEAADVIFTNGKLITMDPSQPAAEGIAIRGNRILAVGGREDVARFQGDHTTLIDLGGRTLMPGFVDAHSHLFDQPLLSGQDPLPSQQMAIEQGITTEADMYVDPPTLDKIKALSEAGKLRMRLNLYLIDDTGCGDAVGDWWKAYRPNAQIGPRLYIRGVKIFADGGSCKVPAVSVEYPGGGMGDLFWSQDQLNQMVVDAQASGFQVAIHALGDRAVDQALDAIAFALKGAPNTYRHRIEHNATVRPDQLTRYGVPGVVPVIFGAYPTCIRTGSAGKFKYLLPVLYGAWDWPWRALVDANPQLPFAWHSDFPVFGTSAQTLSPVYNMWGMVTRKAINTDGSICNPPEWLKVGSLTIAEVLPMMTVNAAYALWSEGEVGSLEAGKLADMVILSDDPVSVDPDHLRDINVLMTLIDGKLEYCATGFEGLCPPTKAPPATSPSTAPVTSSSNLALTASVTASASLPDSPPSNAVDGNFETIWNSGSDPEQWIQLTLSQPRTITAIRLGVSQYPEGETVHQIWGGESEASLRLLHEFAGHTAGGQELEFNPSAPIPGIRVIRIVTTKSPSWVSWREIDITGL